MQELQKSRKIAKMKVMKKQKLWWVLFDGKLQKSKDLSGEIYASAGEY
jgi:hypothetical protein